MSEIAVKFDNGTSLGIDRDASAAVGAFLTASLIAPDGMTVLGSGSFGAQNVALFIQKLQGLAQIRNAELREAAIKK